jgi:phosphoglycerol transferase MdoB-like AlkP superfamily enzyme
MSSSSTLATRTAPAAGGRTSILHGRYFLVAFFAAVYVATSLVTRAVLAFQAWRLEQVSMAEMPRLFLTGIGYDLVACLYVVALYTLYLAFLPQRIYRLRAHRVFIWVMTTLVTFGVLYLGVVEYFFFDEFNSRFNFVAVEYLIYPHEVFVNIWQSYPVAQALAGCAAATAALLWAFRARIGAALASEERLRQRMLPAGGLAIALVAVHLAVNMDTGRAGVNRVADEIGGNGIYSFFNAAVNSQLDYPQFYLTLSEAEAAGRVRRLVAQPNTAFIAGAKNPIARRVSYPGTPKPLHVIVLLEESLGSEFVGAFGDKRGLTPNLDRLAAESLVFYQTYASGTRTVRGMEAVSASFPPVPAESIVKRKGNEGMFNWSTVMQKNGYAPTFIYGGYGTFDNMNYFFGNNGYRVVDRTQMDKPKFSNIWGVSDQDLFDNAFKVFDAQVARRERIFSVVMTTSNHKPFTFPEGIEGIKPKGGGRDTGVRYADYAIGHFLDELRKRPWFKDTMVVIAGDHGARVYGREDIPLPTYEIPFLVYSPGHVAPGRVDTLTSQLDIAPTVLGLLGISYDSIFFGRDALAGGNDRPFALLNHNRDIALYRDGQLSELGFRKTTGTLRYDPATRTQAKIAPDPESTKDAASIFQLAYSLFEKREYRLP